MKYRGLVLALRGPALILLAVLMATLIPHRSARLIQEGNYPAVVCPGAFTAGSQHISLPSEGLSARTVARASQSFHLQKSLVLTGKVTPLLVSGNPGSEVVFQSVSGGSTADAVCEVGGVDQWFIGGSGGVTSQGILEIINSGLSDSTVQIFPYNSKAVLAPIAVSVKANSSQRISLASIVPGDEAVALHLVTESGRVSSFLLDHRKSGLSELGSSFVPPVEVPARKIFIGGILGESVKATSVVRFLVPGNVNATVHLSIFSDGGTFTPVGFDSVSINHQRVVDLPLPPLALSGPFGIAVSSDQPIFAAALTKRNIGGADFAWAGHLTPLSTFKFNLAGAGAQFLFMGSSISLRAEWSDSKGKPTTAVISGEASALFHPTGPLNTITFTPLSPEVIYGGAIVSNIDGGVNYLPLLSNHLTSQAQAPVADLRTLARH
jgi:hypothetical protein